MVWIGELLMGMINFDGRTHGLIGVSKEKGRRSFRRRLPEHECFDKSKKKGFWQGHAQTLR